MVKDNRPYMRREVAPEADSCTGCMFDGDESCCGGCDDDIWVAEEPSMLLVLLPIITLYVGLLIGLVAGVVIGLG